MASVYVIGFPNGKCYVGITSRTVEKRFKVHVRISRKTPKYAIHHAIRKHGSKNVRLMTIIHGVSWEEALDLEVWWISRLNTFKGPGYNVTAGGEGMLGRVMTTETRAKIGKANKGRKHTAEAKAKISKGNMGNTSCVGNKISAETRAKLSKANKGYKHTIEARAKISKAHTGRVFTAEHRVKLSKANKGRKLSSEAVAKMIGRVPSAETRAKMSKSAKEAHRRRREAVSSE